MAQLSEDMVLSPEGCTSVDLRISGLAGHVCNIAADQSWRVHEVKDAIEAVTQISRWQQNLLCNTTKLTDGELLGNLVQGQFTELTLVRHSAEKADWLRLAHTEWSDLLKADKAAWADRDVVLAAVGQCGWALQHATEDLQGDREVVLEAVAQNGLTFQYAARELRQDWDIALAAVKQCGRALEFLADELIVNRDFMLAAMRQNGRSLKYAAHEFRADREVAMAAVRQCGSALVGAAKHLRADYELVAEAVLCDGGALAFAAAPLRADPELKALASQGCIRRESSGSFTSKAEPEAEASESRSYSFGNGTSDGNLGLKRVLGSKGALLCEMAKLGLPVPPGFCVTTHLDHVRGMQRGARPSELRDMLKERLAEVERTTGCRFGDPANPLLLSVRSEAGDSMIAGLNDSIAEAWVGRESDSLRFVCDTYRRLIVTYAQDVKHLDMQPFQDKLNDTLQRLDAKCELGRKHHDADIPVRDLQDLVASFKLIYQQQAGEEFPQDPEVQLWEALRAAFSPSEGSLHTVAATIQAMVFGNFGSLSAVGVVSLKEGANGTEVDGEWLANAQDRDMAAGLRTPQKLTTVAAREWAARQGMSEQERAVSFSSLEEEMPEVYASLIHCQDTLSSHLRSSPAVEFVVQEGTLWLVQGAEYSSASKADPLDNISDCSTGTPTSETTAEKTEVSLDLALVDDTTSEHTEQTRTATLCFGMSQEDPCPFEVSLDQGSAADASPKTLEEQNGGSLQVPDAHCPFTPVAFDAFVDDRDCFETCDVTRSELFVHVKEPTSFHKRAVSAQPHSAEAAESTAPSVVGGSPTARADTAPAAQWSLLKLPLWQTLLAGGCAGFASRWAGNSAEQLAQAIQRAGSSVGGKAAGRAVAAGLAAGGLAGCYRALPTGAICTTFYFNLLSQASADGHPDGTGPVSRLGCAAAAATIANTLMHPIDVVRSRIPAAGSPAAALAAAARGGPRGIFRGLRPALAATVPVVSVELCAIDLVRRVGVDAGFNVSPALLMGAGGVAGALSQTLIYPVNAARNSPGDVQSSRKSMSRSVWKALQTTVLAQSHDSLFKGIGAAYARSIPAAGMNSLVRVGMLTEFMQRSEQLA